MLQGPWDVAVGSAWELAGARTRMVSKLFQTNHDNAQSIIDIVYLAGHAMGKGCTSDLHKLLVATQIEKLPNTRIANLV